MISFDEALKLIGASASALGSETVPLTDACDRVLASPVVARVDSPRAAVSAMDGYALRDADLGVIPARLKVVGQSFAGGGSDRPIDSGETVRIFTGAPVPPGADRVVMQENVRRDGDWAIIEQHPGNARHIRERGGDFRAGDELVAVGTLLNPRAIVAAAGADLREVEVHVRPRVHILSTGDELAEPGTAAATPNLIPESVSFGVAALAERSGAQVVGRKRLPDVVEVMSDAALAAVQRCDLVVVTGGASVGEKDFAKKMFEPVGLELIFSKVAIKPGKPVWLGRAGDALVLGLPGNPTSALVTARLLLAPLLAQLTGRRMEEVLQWRSIPMARSLTACGDRETFHRARLADGAAEPVAFQESSAQKALADADLLVRQHANSPEVPSGAGVQVLDF